MVLYAMACCRFTPGDGYMYGFGSCSHVFCSLLMELFVLVLFFTNPRNACLIFLLFSFLCNRDVLV